MDPAFAVILAAVLLGWGSAIVHAARLRRWGMVLIMVFVVTGLWLFWWPLHRREPRLCKGAP